MSGARYASLVTTYTSLTTSRTPAARPAPDVEHALSRRGGESIEHERAERLHVRRLVHRFEPLNDGRVGEGELRHRRRATRTSRAPTQPRCPRSRPAPRRRRGETAR